MSSGTGPVGLERGGARARPTTMSASLPRLCTRSAPVLLLSVALVLSGCGDQSPSGQPQDPSASPTGATVVEVYEDVSYYGACGNEVLHHEDLVYYPLLSEELEDFDPTPYALGPGPLPAVAPPGPGDDTGTLTVYSDGYARFVSDSGMETWLTEESREYNWVC